jgi:hypothetical protein
VVLILKEGLKMLFPQAPVFDLVRYLILGLWITVGAPALFSALRLRAAAASRKEPPPEQKERPLDV